MHGISTINIELTDRCNKNCWMCGRRKNETKDKGDMDFALVLLIAGQIPPGIVVQLHWNGEPTLYLRLADAIQAFKARGAIVCLNTNGLTIGDQRDVLKRLSTVTVSIIENETEDNKIVQLEQISRFLQLPEDDRPILNIRALGQVDPIFRYFDAFKKVNWVSRILHAPEMSREYRAKPTMPEIGICLDLLHHPAIDRHGDVYPCVRNNPDGINWLGRVGDQAIATILGGPERKELIRRHLAGERNRAPLCQQCDFWGCPTAMKRG